jgi:hypothetical protein
MRYQDGNEEASGRWGNSMNNNERRWEMKEMISRIETKANDERRGSFFGQKK